MENPATWGRAEQIIHDIIVEQGRHHAAVRAGTERPIMGFSTVKLITNALRAEGLLQQMVDADGHCDVCGTFLDGAGCPVCDGDAYPPPPAFAHDPTVCISKDPTPGTLHALRCPAYKSENPA